ncbi:threonine synthase [Serpentinicella alkaliphila]|uniref:Threonine synthase n=1 Tax=Serpentinicella alkaliphila TaxID=1734049 RepID=A0A4R2TWN5_9FIRM|nr:threonine synthase [Serpentinicella alkaliphila]QUH25944.1 threonine synthase [Serpentinicella alkaliphila]TCQ02049.1 threonine synthase [Serpentinicella alkaliphila]
MNYICNDCKSKYPINDSKILCNCGGMLNLEKDILDFTDEDINKREFSLFRYLKVLPFNRNEHSWRKVSMGEGLTPIIPFDDKYKNILLKMDYLMPTLSFKDRGAVVLIAKAKELGITKVIQDSSGNAGNSVAAYASRVGISCDIYVPEGTSEKKVKQIEAHGAKVHIISGTREDTAKEALKAVNKGDGFYASHVYNPIFYEGTKTYVYEVYEQLNGCLPHSFVIPVGNGTLLLGVYIGLLELLEYGLISKLPKIIGVQAENCAPIFRAFVDGKEVVDPVENYGTKAEGIAIADPKRGKQILEAISKTNGTIITAKEEKILEAQKLLAKKGLYVEVTTAATLAAYLEYIKENNEISNQNVIIPLCGAGLKSS